MKRLILVSFLVFYLGIPLAYAGVDWELWNSTLVQLKDTLTDTGPYSRTVTSGGVPIESTTSCKLGSGCVYLDGDDRITFNNDDGFFTTSINQTLVIWVNESKATGYELVMGNIEDPNTLGYLRFVFDITNAEITCTLAIPGFATIVTINGVSNYPKGNFDMFVCGVNKTSSGYHEVWLYRNATLLGKQTGSFNWQGSEANWDIGYQASGGTNFYQGGVDHAILVNRSPDSSYAEYLWNNGVGLELGIDNSPPNITFYNMTSDSRGCTLWNINKGYSCNVTDSTPTLVLETGEISWCRIGRTDQNFTNMGSSRECSGGGSMNHTCTLTPADQLTEQIPYNLYIGCKDTWDNENRTSTSGPLNITYQFGVLTEDLAREAIEAGIVNALSDDYFTYTDTRIYLRSSANQQSTGVFDKVVKWSNKIWAFNYLTGTDTPANLFNMTPSFYALDMENLTWNNINSTVYQMIVSTK